MVYNRKQRDLNNADKIKIRKWKKPPRSGGLGLISNDYNAIYNRWKNSTHCENCGHNYSYWYKCMDHCHLTGVFRNILCHSCNANDRVDNTSGSPNIYWCKVTKRWRYDKTIMGNRILKYFKTKSEAIIFKWLCEAGYSIEV